MILKHIPNILTVARLILIAPFLVFIFHENYLGAFYTFVVAGFTDGLDGWLARYYSWQTPFGTLIDPIADKLLISSSFISLAFSHTLPWSLVFLVFSRDLTISVGALAWYWLIQRKITFQPTFLSKINTVLQLTLVTVCLFERAYSISIVWLSASLIILTAITTTATYLDYVWTWGKKARLSLSHSS